MNKINGLLNAGLLALLACLSAQASANDLNAPQQVIKETSDLVYKVVQNDKSKLDDRNYVFELVNEILEPRVDLDKVSKLVLGKYWRTANDEQKVQFQKEFKGLLVNTYATAFKEFDEWTIHFIPMPFDSTEKRLIVKTEIIQPSRPPVAVDYRMALNETGEWKAYDVIIEGISMVTNYKASFSKTIKAAGRLDKVILQLAEKNKLSETSSQLALDKANKNS